MQFSNKLILVLAIFASNAYARCFNAGTPWFNDDESKNNIKTGFKAACTYMLKSGPFNVEEERKYPMNPD